MTFAGLRSPNDRVNLIAYLRTQSDSPMAIPPPQPAKAAAGADVRQRDSASRCAKCRGGQTTQGPNGTAAVAPGNQPVTGTSTAGSGNAASGSAGNANGPSGGDSGKDSSLSGSTAHIGNSPAPVTGKRALQQPPKKPLFAAAPRRRGAFAA